MLEIITIKTQKATNWILICCMVKFANLDAMSFGIIPLPHRRISRHALGGAENNVALMTGICLSVFALISIMKILFSHENLPFFALISSKPEC